MKTYYAAPNGSGSGSDSHPLSIHTAFDNSKTPVRPGDELVLRGPSYSPLAGREWHHENPGGNDPIFTCSLKGEPGARITVRAEKGLVSLDGRAPDRQGRETLRLIAEYTDLLNLRAWNSAPCHPGPYVQTCPLPDASGVPADWSAKDGRTLCRSASSPWLMRGHGLNDGGLNNRIINCVIHDGGNGIFSGAAGRGTEIYGCIIYYCGWEAPDRGHGHGLYLQNAKDGPRKRVEACIIHSMFGFGAQVFTTNGFTDNIDFVRNVVFDGGLLQVKEGDAGNPNFIVAGNPKGSVTEDNFFYFTGSRGRHCIGMGGRSGSFKRNLVIGGRMSTFMVDGWSEAFDCNENTFVALNGEHYQFSMKEDALPSISKQKWSKNRYFHPSSGLRPFVISKDAGSEPLEFAGWQQRLGIDSDSTFAKGLPSDRVTVIPNKYERGLGTVVIENYSQKESVTVDLALLNLQEGEAFEIRDPKNYFANPVFSGAYTGPVSVKVKGLSNAAPVGYAVPARSLTELVTTLIVQLKVANSEPIPEPTPEPTPTPDPEPTPTPEPIPEPSPMPEPTTKETLTFEAETRVLLNGMEIGEDARASGGKYVFSPNSGPLDKSTETTPRLKFVFNVKVGGSYVVWARVLTATPSSDSFHVAMDDVEDIFDAGENRWGPEWQWVHVNGRAGKGPLTQDPRVFSLAAGSHELVFSAREAASALDAIVITNDPAYVPSGTLPQPEPEDPKPEDPKPEDPKPEEPKPEEPDPGKHARYEYRLETIPTGKEARLKLFNEMGADGWRFCEDIGAQGYFERQILE